MVLTPNLSRSIVHRFLIVTYIVFIFFGLASLTISTLALSKVPSVGQETEKGFNFDGWLQVFSSLVDLLIGIIGLIAILLSWRVVLKFIVGILAIAIVANIVVLVISFTTTRNKSISKIEENRINEKIVKYYGNRSSPEYRGFTELIDSTQDTEKCCGWNDEDEADNVFVKSPWHRLVNLKPPNGKTISVPDSCCKEVGPKCREAENLKEARKNKVVHEIDCVTKLNNPPFSSKWYSIGFTLSAFILQALCISGTTLWTMCPAE